MSVSNPPRYATRDVPATGTDQSRFALGVTPTGIPSARGATIAVNYEKLARELTATAVPITVQTQTVKLKAVVRAGDGYALVPRGTISGPLVSGNRRPGKLGAQGLRAGALLDSFYLGEDGFEKYGDAALFDALLALAEQERPDGQTLRRWNDLLACTLAVRAGLAAPHPGDLPNAQPERGAP
jgi:hypothetical protein